MTTFDPNTLSISFLLCTTITFTLTQAATFDIRNDCSFRLWAVADPGGSKQLDNGETWTFNTNLGSVKGRAKIWAQTNCNSNGNGGCQNYTLPPFTLAEYSVNHLNNSDFFDISLVKGFNVPMEFSPTSDGCSKGIKCVGDINEQCPQELLDPAGCNNACTVFENDQYCCRSTKCEPTIYSEFFKGLCPDAYSNPFDNATSTFTCPPGTNYTVVFCSTGTKTLPDTVQDYLNAHNRARAEVGVGPLSWDDNIATYAQDYANKHKGDCNLVHSGGPYGENLAGSSGSMTGVDAVNLWVAEKANYDYNSNTCAAGAVCGHYTQVVWRNSVRVGCGKVQCDNGGTFIGCNYDPRGNYVNEKPY